MYPYPDGEESDSKSNAIMKNRCIRARMWKLQLNFFTENYRKSVTWEWERLFPGGTPSEPSVPERAQALRALLQSDGTRNDFEAADGARKLLQLLRLTTARQAGEAAGRSLQLLPDQWRPRRRRLMQRLQKPGRSVSRGQGQ